MQLLIIDSAQFIYKPASLPLTSINCVGVNRCHKYFDALIVQCAIERGDKQKFVCRATKDISQLFIDFECKQLVVLPNVHLTHKPAGARASLEIISSIFYALSAIHESVHLEPFGYFGEWELQCRGHAKSVLGRHYG